ncbi:unnamed protein product [Ceratitis capitata]|uniref:(Mediterranean fruit fly) hypothetical protein n=1 Tax=Ceratitis capitata TaxID=7213 RepID=A0A811U1T3_CERCA|nr:unnamed protein product [Ceratitis capitata]
MDEGLVPGFPTTAIFPNFSNTAESERTAYGIVSEQSEPKGVVRKSRCRMELRSDGKDVRHSWKHNKQSKEGN